VHGEPDPRGLRRLAWALSSRDSADQPPRYLGPNWFASVMGTGIIANAAATLPYVSDELHPFAVAVWIADALLLVLLTLAVAVHWTRHPDAARGYAADPTMSQFFGAPPMALMVVGAGTLLVGRSVIGLDAALAIDWVLWSLGTIGGLLSAAAVPFLLFTRQEVRPDAAFGGWLMPVVPPMVSAATGALLLPHVAAGPARETLFYGCYAMFGLSLVASLIIITLIWSRLAYHGSTGTARVATLWIVLGPLGQSITAAGLLGGMASITVDDEIATAFRTFALLYGVPVFGFAVLWAGIAAAMTIRTVRRRLPFALTWWSFTFPVGTCVTGTTQLARHSDLPAFRVAAVVLYVALVGAWLLVAFRTVHASLRGTLLAPPESIAMPATYKG
jgi:C4-dicarboxylate transporter/malic acid transport protein